VTNFYFVTEPENGNQHHESGLENQDNVNNNTDDDDDDDQKIDTRNHTLIMEDNTQDGRVTKKAKVT
jgi:hypothetical protein